MTMTKWSTLLLISLAAISALSATAGSVGKC